MKAEVTYKLRYELHPWNEKMRANHVRAWILFEVVTPEICPSTEQPVAIFNFDSDAERFQAHVHASGLDGRLVSIDPQWAQAFDELQRLRGKTG